MTFMRTMRIPPELGDVGDLEELTRQLASMREQQATAISRERELRRRAIPAARLEDDQLRADAMRSGKRTPASKAVKLEEERRDCERRASASKIAARDCLTAISQLVESRRDELVSRAADLERAARDELADAADRLEEALTHLAGATSASSWVEKFPGRSYQPKMQDIQVPAYDIRLPASTLLEVLRLIAADKPLALADARS